MKTYTVSEEEKKQFATGYLLEKMINSAQSFSILLEGNDKDLEPILEFMMMKDYIEIKDHRYVPAGKGREVLKSFTGRYTDFLRNFDVYCAVDLDSGNFAFEEWFEYEDEESWDGYLEDERWEDLRVAVAEFKKINPVEIVFMSFLNETRFGADEEGWQFDLLLGSIWDEILEICNSALKVADLGYSDDEGNQVSGEDVIMDTLRQGAELNIWVKQEEAKMEEADGGSDAGGGPVGVERVEPEEIEDEVYRGYCDPHYVNPVWRRRWF